MSTARYFACSGWEQADWAAQRISATADGGEAHLLDELPAHRQVDVRLVDSVVASAGHDKLTCCMHVLFFAVRGPRHIILRPLELGPGTVTMIGHVVAMVSSRLVVKVHQVTDVLFLTSRLVHRSNFELIYLRYRPQTTASATPVRSSAVTPTRQLVAAVAASVTPPTSATATAETVRGS